ncbi:MAG: bile acid:sodium symporter family protein [Candidatus Aminicenantales bacterium]
MSKRKIFLAAFLVAVALLAGSLIAGLRSWTGVFAIAGLAAAALYAMSHAALKSFAFTLWVFAFVAASMFHPAAFGTWFGADLRILIVPLIQVIMFGMGTTLSARDFGRVLTMPWPILIGVVLQFTIMPLVGWGIATVFGFDAEVAAGIILIGSVSSGLASNVMSYLAGGNVPLSVTITSVTTLISPFATPLWMKLLAGRLIPVNVVEMMMSILNMIIVPVVAGLVAHRILYGDGGDRPGKRGAAGLAVLAAAALASGAGVILVKASTFGVFAPLKGGLVLGFFLVGFAAAARLAAAVWLKTPSNWIDRALPSVSMFGICLIIGIITARSRNELLSVGMALFAAAILHNGLGYFLGYWGARAARLDESSCRTVAFEVGMQNGGMASGIAMEVLKSSSAALAPAIFGPWMNISGSILANWWRRHPAQGPGGLKK